MSLREKGAWVIVGVLTATYGWYLASVLGQLIDGSANEIAYQQAAVAGLIAFVVLAALSHLILAATGRSGPPRSRPEAVAIKRYSRCSGAIVVTVAAVLGMALAMFEADYFWIANVILAGLVVSELASALAEILTYRRGI